MEQDDKFIQKVQNTISNPANLPDFQKVKIKKDVIIMSVQNFCVSIDFTRLFLYYDRRGL